MDDILVSLAILVVAFLYSSVGHGGGSGYLAVMSFAALTANQMRTAALLLNLLVSFTAFIEFYRKGYFRHKIFLSVTILSVPLAFIGASFGIAMRKYRIILGVVLLLSALRLAGFLNPPSEQKREIKLVGGLVLGGIIGFVSGLVGVGGGIFLSPLLLFLRWADAKETAAISAPFIFVNSVAGLMGLLYGGHFSIPSSFPVWVICAILGGIAGSHLGAFKFSNITIRRLLAIVLVIAGTKLLVL